MTAVDTNVLVGLLTGDDPKQAAAARSLFAAGPIWIAKTVLLEAGWVLRSLYGFEESAICDAFTKLLGLKNVHAEDESSVAAALTLTERGIELAGAMHLTTSREALCLSLSTSPSFSTRGVRGHPPFPPCPPRTNDAEF
jgi:predicted nucleic-acid-binding protein